MKERKVLPDSGSVCVGARPIIINPLVASLLPKYGERAMLSLCFFGSGAMDGATGVSGAGNRQHFSEVAESNDESATSTDRLLCRLGLGWLAVF